jgi:pilus assembly protein CpaB
MNFIRNRTVIGVICILMSLVICFAVTPLFNAGLSQKVNIVRVTKDITTGEQITKDMVQTVQVGGYNLPLNVVKKESTAVGKYASTDLLSGDYILSSKLNDSPSGNFYLNSLDGKKQAISVTIKKLADSLSGKLLPGDIVSVIAPDYKKQGTTVIPDELQYVEVIAVTASTGSDTNTVSSTASQSTDKESSLPATVTLLATPEQSKILAELDSNGSLHMSLVYRGTKANAAMFIQSQDSILAKLYPQTNAATSSQP